MFYCRESPPQVEVKLVYTYIGTAEGRRQSCWLRVRQITCCEQEVCTMGPYVYWIIDLLEGFVYLISVGMEG